MRQINLGQLIDDLKKCKQDNEIYFDFANLTPQFLDSYRGYYDQLAIAFDGSKNPKVSDFLKQCQEALGKIFQGWKGGDFKMDEKTAIWVSNPGECGDTAVSRVEDEDHCTIIHTGYYEG